MDARFRIAALAAAITIAPLFGMISSMAQHGEVRDRRVFLSLTVGEWSD